MTSNELIRPGYKQTDVGVIPVDWECAPLDDYISYISYGFTNPMPTAGSGVFMVTAADVADGRINYETARYTTPQAFEQLLTAKSRPKKNDLLLTKDGALGRLALVGDQTICVNQSVAVLRANKKVTPEFLKILLQADAYQRKMIEDAGGSTIKHIYITIVNLMLIAVPRSIDEQRAIVVALSDADALIASLDALIAKKCDLKQAAIQQLLTGKTRLPGFKGEWEVKRLGDVAHIKTGKKNNEDKVEEGAYPLFVRSQTVERINSYSYDCEAILVPGEGGIGSIFHYINGKFDCHQRVYKVSEFCANTSGKFVFFCMKYRFHEQATRNSVKATVDFLRLPTFQTFEFLCPALDEQIAIAAVLSDMDADLAALEGKRDKACALKQGMMQELLTGRIRLV